MVETSPESLVRQWMEEGWNQGKDDAIEACFHPDFAGHDSYQEPLYGHAGVRSFVHDISYAFADFSVRVDDILVEDDRVAARITATARHVGEFMGHAPTRARLTFAVFIIFCVRDGRFHRAWQHWDVAGIVRSIREVSGGELAGLPTTELGGDLGPAPPTGNGLAEEVARNKERVRYWLEQAWNRHRISVVDEVIAEDFCFHDAYAGVIRGQDGMRDWVQGLDSALQDDYLIVEQLVAEGDKVACRITFEGVHNGDLFSVAVTGKKFRSGALFIVQLTEGRFHAAWQVWDLFRVLQQISAV